MNKKIITAVLFSIIIMAVIFAFSAQNGDASSGLSLKFSKIFAKIIFLKYDSLPEQLQTTIVNELNGFVRKAAHFTIYALLGASVFAAVKLFVKKLKKQLIITACVCAAYAAADEIHQLFTGGREGRITDVLIDSAGFVFGVIIVLVICSAAFYFKSFIKENSL